MIRLLDHGVQLRGLGQHRHHLALGNELDLGQHQPLARVIDGHDQCPIAEHQGDDLQPIGHVVGQLGQRPGVDREFAQVHQGVAHLARQRQQELLVGDQPHLHQQFTQRHRTVMPLTLQRAVKLLIVDQPHGDQRLADAHHGHAALLVDCRKQLLPRDHQLRLQDLAQLFLAQDRLLLHLAGHLLFGQHLGVDETRSTREAKVGIGQHVTGHEETSDRAFHAIRRKQKHPVAGLGMPHRHTFQVCTALDRHPVWRHLACIKRVHPPLCRLGHRRHHRPCQAQAAKLAEAQGHRGARRWHLDVGHPLLWHEEAQPALHDPPIEPLDLAGLRLGLRHRRRVHRERRHRPAEHTVVRPAGFVSFFARQLQRRQAQFVLRGRLRRRKAQVGIRHVNPVSSQAVTATQPDAQAHVML